MSNYFTFKSRVHWIWIKLLKFHLHLDSVKQSVLIYRKGYNEVDIIIIRVTLIS